MKIDLYLAGMTLCAGGREFWSRFYANSRMEREHEMMKYKAVLAMRRISHVH